MNSSGKLGLLISAQSGADGTRPARTVQYRVTGLPADQQAWIGLNAKHRWSYLRERSGIQGSEWCGSYQTAEEALLGLEDEIQRTN
jgi:hypothetical protein